MALIPIPDSVRTLMLDEWHDRGTVSGADICYEWFGLPLTSFKFRGRHQWFVTCETLEEAEDFLFECVALMLKRT